MKKIVAIALVMLMVLSLAGCGEEAKLYEKYADIITMLENKDYTIAMGHIASMAAAEQAANEEPRPAAVELVADDWYIMNEYHVDAPKTVTIGQDGTCTVDGKAMTWVENYSDENGVEGLIVDNGEHKYMFSFYSRRDDGSTPTLNLSKVEAHDGGFYGGDSLGEYLNHARANALMVDWQLLDGEEGMSSWFSIGSNSIWLNDISFNWVITSEETEDTVVAELTARDGHTDKYTLVMAQRDGHYVLSVTNGETGATGLYINEELYGYETSWPEYQYPQVMRHLRNYLNNGYFWPDDGASISGNAARAVLYDMFQQLGDYRDSADYMARFSTQPSTLTQVVQKTTDQLGNVSDSVLETYTYDEQGRMISGKGEYMMETYGIYEDWSTMYLEYDAAGKVSKITIGKDTVSGVCTPGYDAQGRLATMQVQRTNAAYTSTFTYDEQGRISRVDIGSSNYGNNEPMYYVYTYDEAGRLIQKVKSLYKEYYNYYYDYVYEGDTLVQIVETYRYRADDKYTTTYTFTNDDQGRPLSAAVTTTNSDVTYTAREKVYTYEELFFFDASGLETEN